MCAASSLVWAAPTPIPGGALQLKGVNGTIHSTLFDGKVRVRKMAFRLPIPSDNMGLSPDERGIVLTCIVSNGTHATRTGYFKAKLVDADGVVQNSYGGDPIESAYTLPPGGAARQSFRFMLKSGFTPVKVLLQEQVDVNSPVFRMTIASGDIPQT